MIARVWRGWTAKEDGDAYVEYLKATGMKESRETPGNRGVYVLRRSQGEREEFVTVTLWESLEAVASFAGDEVERAVFFPEDDRYLVERELSVAHYEIAHADLAGA